MKKLITPLIILFLASCGSQSISFDRELWHKREDMFYPYREAMVDDLMKNHLTKGISWNQLVELIGQPENYANMDSGNVGYEVMVDYGWNIDPVEGKTLFFELDQDSTVTKYWLDHWKR